MRVVETHEFYAELEDYLQWVRRQVLDADMGEEIFLGDITIHDMTLEEWEAIPKEEEIWQMPDQIFNSSDEADAYFDEAGEIYGDFTAAMERLIDAIDEYVGFFKDDSLDFLRELLSNTHARYQPETKGYD